MRKRFFALLNCFTLLAACTQEVYSDLTQQDANEMVAMLRGHGIDAQRSYNNGKFRVLVNDKEFARSINILSGNGLPRTNYRTLEQVFPSDKMIATPVEQKARYVYALGEEISRTISLIDGVRVARVHIVIPETDIRGRTSGRTTASVLVQTMPGIDSALIVPYIRTVVVNAVPNIKPGDISVVSAQYRMSQNEPR